MGDSEDFCGSSGALPLKLDPERWLWCLHCERFFQAKDLRSDFTGGKQGCAFDGCDGAGWKMDIFDWNDWNQDDDLSHWPKPEDELTKGQLCPLYPEKTTKEVKGKETDQDLNQKNEILKEVFADFKREGLVPWINERESDDDLITVDGICIHGKGLESREIRKEEESSLWIWEGGPDTDGFCDACNPDCDCGKPHKQKCPICKGPWPVFTEEQLIQAWKNDEDLSDTTNCPKCGHSWTLSIEEMEKLHPEALAKTRPEKPESITQPAQVRPIRNGRLIGRNSECPCGSGKKYKRCCEKGSPNK